MMVMSLGWTVVQLDVYAIASAEPPNADVLRGWSDSNVLLTICNAPIPYGNQHHLHSSAWVSSYGVGGGLTPHA